MPEPPPWRPERYGDDMADVYDEWFGNMRDTEAAVEFLASLAGTGSTLELGIGTGRVALPLARRGITVHGIDASEAMVGKLREKPGGENIPVEIGDFSNFTLPDRYSLVFVVFQTFFNLSTQEAQVRCFRNVTRHLEPDGLFVVEAFVPDPTRFDDGQATRTKHVAEDRVALETSTHDPAHQIVRSQNILVSESGTRLYSAFLRYVWPSEMDLMAELAGMKLRNRYSGWSGEPFDSRSTRHISVYEKTP